MSQIEAGHFDAETAYASVDRHRLADNHPYIYRTHDGGKTWQNIVDGIPDGAYVNSIKEDPKQKGLLYAATELRVYVSFDDGDHWQPLQHNMPVTSVRDSSCTATISPSPPSAAASGFSTRWRHCARSPRMAARLSRPTRIFLRRATHLPSARAGRTARRMPHEEPQEKNPPSGVLAYYWLKSAPSSRSSWNSSMQKGKVAACLASDTPVKPVDTETINVQAYWLVPPAPPSAAAGMHRATLNVAAPNFGFGRRPAPPPADACHPAAAGTPPPAAAPMGFGRATPVLEPGQYTIRLTVDGNTLTQPVIIKPDPRNLPAGATPPSDDDDDQ